MEKNMKKLEELNDKERVMLKELERESLRSIIAKAGIANSEKSEEKLDKGSIFLS